MCITCDRARGGATRTTNHRFAYACPGCNLFRVQGDFNVICPDSVQVLLGAHSTWSSGGVICCCVV
jgi:hypothetical protein